MPWVRGRCSFCGFADWVELDEDGLCATCLQAADELAELEASRQDGDMPSLPFYRSPARLD